MKKEMVVAGYRPAYGQQVNDFMKMFDLGTDGIFVSFKEIVEVVFKETVTEQQLENAPDVLKQGYESVGCMKVFVTVL